MADEQRKEICKAFYVHKMTVNDIAEAFNIDQEKPSEMYIKGKIKEVTA